MSILSTNFKNQQFSSSSSRCTGMEMTNAALERHDYWSTVSQLFPDLSLSLSLSLLGLEQAPRTGTLRCESGNLSRVSSEDVLGLNKR